MTQVMKITKAFHILSLLWSLSWLVFVVKAETYAFSVPPGLPSNASPKVDPSFPNFGFEESSIVPYSTCALLAILSVTQLTFLVANGTPNTFSQNLLNAVFSRTGGKPILRIGGTTGFVLSTLALRERYKAGV